MKNIQKRSNIFFTSKTIVFVLETVQVVEKNGCFSELSFFKFKIFSMTIFFSIDKNISLKDYNSKTIRAKRN